MDASTYRLYAHAALHTDALTLETRRIVGQTARVAGSRACCLSNTGCNELAGAALIFVTAVAVRMLLGPEHPYHWVCPTAYYPGLLLRQLFRSLEWISEGFC